MSGVGVTFAGTDTGLNALMKKQAKTAGEITVEMKRAAREMKASEQAGVRSFKMQQTAAEKYRRELININIALRAGLITQRQADRAIGGANQKLRGHAEFAKSIASAGGRYLTTWFSIQAAIQLATREMAEQAAIFDKTVTSSDKMADSIRRLIANVGPNVSAGDKVAFVQQLVALGQQKDVAIKPSILIGEAARLVSATTGEFAPRKDIVLRTLKQIAPLFISQPEEVGAFGGGFQAFLTTMQKDGIKLKDPETFGLFLQAQSQVRLEDIKKLTNIIPVIRAVEASASIGAGGRPTGQALTLEDAKATIAAFARIGAEANEKEGEKTRTAMIKMVKVMEDRFPDLSFVQQLSAVEGLSPAAQQELFGPLSALRSIGPIVQAFLRDTEKQEFATIVRELVIDAEAAKETRLQMLNLMEVLQQNTATKQAEAIAEVRRIDELGGAAGARARISELIESELGFGFRTLARIATNLDFALGRDPEAIERGATEFAFGATRERLEAIPEGETLTGNLRRLSEALERQERIYSQTAPALQPEN